MKKNFACFVIVCFAVIAFSSWLIYANYSKGIIYLNANDEISYSRLEKLSKELRKQHYQVVLSDKENHQSGKFNLYASNDFGALPKVLDKDAINFLWVPTVQQGDLVPLHPFDVIVVQNMPSFAYLKAINARTAFIPEAINITAPEIKNIGSKLMFYGDNEGFSLSLYLAGPTDLEIDIYGKGFEGLWDSKSIMKDLPHTEDFQRYALVLVDQKDENIRDELLDQRIIDVIEQGSLPYVRYNTALVKIFGDTIPMYKNGDEFLSKLSDLRRRPEEIKTRLKDLRRIGKDWDTTSQAKKFIELFEIMSQKVK